MIAVIPGVMISTFVLQMSLLSEDPTRADATSIILAENMARYHNGAYQLVDEQRRDGTLADGMVAYNLTYPFRPLVTWTSEVTSQGTAIWLVTWPADIGTWTQADLAGVIEVFGQQNYRDGQVAEYTPSVGAEWDLPPLSGVIPPNVPVIATRLTN
jgi:hypothetical protein